MKIYILYRPNSEHSRRLEEYAHDFTHTIGTGEIELLSLDTKEGSSLASLYDIVRYPAVVVLGNAGELLKFWQGEEETPPLMDELAAYARA
jgi:hypothetical protein